MPAAEHDTAPPQTDLLEPAATRSPGHADRRVMPARSMEQHRARMRARLLSDGPDALADHELLEMALFLALPRRDTKPIASRLLARFGSLANAIAAPAHEIAAVQGMGEASAAALKLVQAAAMRLSRASR